MVKTFIYGASIEALVEIDRIFVKTVDAYTDALVKAGHLKAGLDLEDAKVAAKTNFSTQTSSYLSTEHSRPLRNVIGIAQPAFLRPKRALKGALKWTEKRFWKRSKRPLVSLCQMRVLSAPGAIGPATMRKTAITPAARTPGTERISRLY
jgi:hypothetical protein